MQEQDEEYQGISRMAGSHQKLEGFPDGTGGKEPTCQCRRHKRHRFSIWVGKIPVEEGTATYPSALA